MALITFIMLFITSLGLIYLNWKFVPFDQLHPIPYHPTPASGNHKSDLFFDDFVCF